MDDDPVRTLVTFDLRATIRRMPRKTDAFDPKILVPIFAGIGLSSFTGFAVLVAILAPVPVSTIALLVFFPGALAMAWLAAGIRTHAVMLLLMMPIILVLTPAIAGHEATVQQPWLVQPLAPLACEPGETLMTTWEKRPAGFNGGGGAAWCVGPRGQRQTYVPELLHMLGLALLFGSNYVLALLVRRAARARAQ